MSHFLKVLTFSQSGMVGAKSLGMLRASLKDFLCCQKLLFPLAFNSAYKTTAGKIVEPEIELSYGQNSASMATVRPLSDQLVIQLNLPFISSEFCLNYNQLTCI